METKKVLFVVSNLACGGINRALESLIRSLEKTDVDISVYAFDTSGQFSKGFSGARMIRPVGFLDYMYRNLSRQGKLQKFPTASVKLLDRLVGGRLRAYLLKREQRRIEKAGYSTIIAFSEGAPTHFVSSIKCGNKLSWLHCDFMSYLNYCSLSRDVETGFYSSFNKIVCVSDYTRITFIDVCPSLKDITVSINNVLDAEKIKQDSMEMEPNMDGDFNLVWVGRIDPVKRPSVLPEVLYPIVKKFPQVHCYLVGPESWASENDMLLANISKFGLGQNMHLLGEKSNPYPFIRKADILINTSVSEACPYVINEAKILGTPIVCTDFGSAKEFVKNGENGYSVSLDKLSDVIEMLLENPKHHSELKRNLSEFEYDNEGILSSIKSLIK